MSERPVINIWANFLMNEKLESTRMDDKNDVLELIELAEALAKIRPPCIRSHKDKLASRRLLCETAMDLGIDLTAIKFRGKMAMGRGLLDAWNLVYREKFGSTVGTASALEAKRRDIKTRLAKQNIRAPRRDI